MVKTARTLKVTNYGYKIFEGDELVYQAGNHKLDSQQYVQPGSVNALSLNTLKKYARQTMFEIEEEEISALIQ